MVMQLVSNRPQREMQACYANFKYSIEQAIVNAQPNRFLHGAGSG